MLPPQRLYETIDWSEWKSPCEDDDDDDDDDDDGNYDDDSGGGNDDDDDDDDDDDTKVSTYLWFFLWRLQKFDEVLELIKFNTHHNIYAKSQREKVNASSSSTSSFISTYAQCP